MVHWLSETSRSRYYNFRNTTGFVYLRFDNTQASVSAQHALHGRWFAGKMITATFLDIALGKDTQMFMRVATNLLLISVIGYFMDFLTLGYISLVIAFTVPALYERYPPSSDCFVGDRYGDSDRYPTNGYGKERLYYAGPYLSMIFV